MLLFDDVASNLIQLRYRLNAFYAMSLPQVTEFFKTGTGSHRLGNRQDFVDGFELAISYTS